MSTQVSPVTYLNPEGASQAQGQYSHVGTPDGKLHFIAGQLAVAPDGSVAGVRDFETQFHQVFNNLGAVLKGLGGDYNNVIKFTTYLVHSQDIKEFKRLRSQLFPTLFAGDNFAPNTMLIVDRLVEEEFLLEVEAVAYIP